MNLNDHLKLNILGLSWRHGGYLLRYPLASYHFPTETAFLVGALETLHTEQEYARHAVGAEWKTVWHERFYAGFPKRIQPIYRRFVRAVVAPLFKEPIIYQRVPTFRVHAPGNVAVGEFHEDGHYNHPSGEINCMLPMTDCQETASIWIESAPGKRDYRPINLVPGDLFIFNGRDCKHGNLPNETGATRVSFDFRVMPESLFVPQEKATWNTGLRFDVGPDCYYERLNVEG